MSIGIKIEPKVDGEAIAISVQGVIDILNAAGANRFSGEVAIAAIETAGRSMSASADNACISNCNIQFDDGAIKKSPFSSNDALQSTSPKVESEDDSNGST